MPRYLLVYFGLIFVPAVSWADVTLHGLFTDHMVLQQKTAVPVWGKAEPEEKVTVTIQGKSASTTAGPDGKWRVKLPELTAGGPYEMVIDGKNRITLSDVLVGEVWICSGQSNMQWTVSQSKDPKETIAAASNSQLRLFQHRQVTSATPLDDVQTTEAWKKWRVCSPESVPGFSAVAYHFGQSLQKSLEVPVGLIHTSWGGTPAEAWTTSEFLEKTPELAHYMQTLNKNLEIWETQREEIEQQYELSRKKHEEQAAQLRVENKKVPNPPRRPVHPNNNPNSPARLYNAMIHPLVPYAFRGAIWYQGESNAGRAYEYRTLFPAMIQSWRNAWGTEFPFYFVQLAPWKKIADKPQPSDWAELREAQFLTSQKLANTDQVVITDTTDPKTDQADIHPKNKQPVGERLALVARAKTYGQPVVCQGPIYSKVEFEGDKAILHFTSIGTGLVCQGSELTGFTLAGEDKVFYPAQASIVGDTVVVTCDAVKQPVAVRFGWADYPVVNFFNKEGLPATPFRTDDWPGITWPKKQ